MEMTESDAQTAAQDEHIVRQTHIAEELIGKVRRLHSKFIFYWENPFTKLCKEDLYRPIVKIVGGTPPLMGGWMDLGYKLGVSTEDMNYIKESTKSCPCPTTSVLRVFVQHTDASMDKLISALKEIERFDVIITIRDPLMKLYETINAMKLFDNNISIDQGYGTSSTIESDEVEETIVRPKYILNELPEVLKCDSTDEEFEEMNRNAVYNLNKPFVLLTYAEDGIRCVKNVIRGIETAKDDISVLTLERLLDVEQNPAVLIPILCEKASFIVPILSQGYVQKITSTREVRPSSDDNKDDAYVRFIYCVIMSKYICYDGCLNKKIRSILPMDADKKAIFDQLSGFLVLNNFTYENNLNTFLKRITI